MDAVAAGDLERARSLMYGSDYDRGKAEVTIPVARFQEILAERTSGLVESARGRADVTTLFAHAAIAAMALAFLAILYGVLSRRIVAPLLRVSGVRMSGVVTRLAGQDYGVEVPDRGRADEIGGIADVAQVMQAAGQTGAASAQVLGAARELSHKAGTLGTGIGRFPASIRAT